VRRENGVAIEEVGSSCIILNSRHMGHPKVKVCMKHYQGGHGAKRNLALGPKDQFDRTRIIGGKLMNRDNILDYAVVTRTLPNWRLPIEFDLVAMKGNEKKDVNLMLAVEIDEGVDPIRINYFYMLGIYEKTFEFLFTLHIINVLPKRMDCFPNAHVVYEIFFLKLKRLTIKIVIHSLFLTLISTT
ncbi:hypothetical protein ACJX0J_008759, partial [Zea mays]